MIQMKCPQCLWLLCALVAVLAAPGCTTVGSTRGHIEDPLWVSSHSTREKDRFTGVEKINSPEMNVGTFGYPSNIQLRRLSKEGTEIYQVYALYYFVDWKFLRSARDEEQTRLDAKVLDTQVLTGTTVVEHLVITVKRDYLEHVLGRGGMTIKLQGQRGNAIFFLPPSLVEGFLMAVDRYTHEE